HAIELAVRQQGKIDGFTLSYWPLDDSLAAHANPVRGVENVDRMIDERRVLGMIGPFSSALAFDEIPEANQANLVMLSPANTNVCLTTQFCDQQQTASRPNGVNNYFRIAAPDPLQGRAMARYLESANPNIKRVAAFAEWDPPPVGDLIIKEFAAELHRHGGELVLQTDLDAGTKDFSKFLVTARDRGAQAIYAVGDSSDKVCLARAQMTISLPGAVFLGTDGVTGTSECLTDAGGNNADGMLSTYIDVDATATKDAKTRMIVDAYRKAYPKALDISIYTFAAYDCARILIAAIAQAIKANHGGFPTRLQVVTAVAQMRGFKGVTGTYSFDANGDAISPLMSIWQVRNGKWVYLQKIDVSPSQTYVG
ncbi:MAG TPA: branched-chain amino acid ABC transporter substrate-binding protein, partial [Candidatus Angelobacter sp.]|nr:branched-chain amino acid ABC transporter substrate-binding protein [Candidatus Angelobacter sp.]